MVFDAVDERSGSDGYVGYVKNAKTALDAWKVIGGWFVGLGVEIQVETETALKVDGYNAVLATGTAMWRSETRWTLLLVETPKGVVAVGMGCPPTNWDAMQGVYSAIHGSLKFKK